MRLDRRQFIKTTSLASGGIAFSFFIAKNSLSSPQSSSLLHSGELFLYATLHADNKVELIFDKTEMGQGVITGQATLFCEEAELDPFKVELIPAPANSAFDTSMGQITGGSTSTSDRYETLRVAGAQFRETLLRAASIKWGVNRSDLTAKAGHISSKSLSKKENYAFFLDVLVKENNSVKSEDIPLKDKKDFNLIGKIPRSVDSFEKSTGKAIYGLDTSLDGMKIAIVMRAPVWGARLKSFDKKALLKIPYVKDAIEINSGIAIICDKYWQCEKARNSITEEMIQWEIQREDRVNSKDMREALKNKVKDRGLKASGDQTLVEALYELPYLSHAPMEPQNCTAFKSKDEFLVIAPTQAPSIVKDYAVSLSGYDKAKVRVEVSKYLGGGFGRRSAPDFSIEAIELATKLDYPIKVIWSREDDMKYSPLRPAGAHKLSATLKDDMIQWDHHICTQSILGDFVPLALGGGLMSKLAGSVINTFGVMPLAKEGAATEYNIEKSVSAYDFESKIPTLFWRSVGHSHNGFVNESFLDEVCHSLKKDPLDYRLGLLKDQPRALAVVKKAAELSGYRSYKPQKGKALGIAYHKSFETHVAEVIEITAEGNNVIVENVWCAVDCGRVVNPHIVTAQMRSGIIFGLTAALHGEITFSDGSVDQNNFYDYRLMGLSEIPDIHVHIIDSEQAPTGVGEPSTPPAAAALANALFNATGIRHRKLPIFAKDA